MTPSPEKQASSRPATVACLECRKVHLKCDGVKPVCGRCRSRRSLCTYTVSRRGRRRGTRRAVNQSAVTDDGNSPCPPFPRQMADPDRGPDTEYIQGIVGTADLAHPNTSSEPPSLSAAIDNPNALQSQYQTDWVDDSQLVNLYYLNFHPNHPILVPRSLYWMRNYPWYLKATVEFIGSHFSGILPTRGLQEDAVRALNRGISNETSVVQACMLYAIILLSQNEIRSCQELLDNAAVSAIEMGLHRREFAGSQAKGQPKEEEESLRRTWYELYVLEGIVAAFQRRASFRSSTVDADVLLPCEDDVYNNGMSTPKNFSRYEFDNNAFVDEEIVFSSFSYRIEAVRLLERVLAITGSHGVERERVQATDNALAAFLHHLPSSKREPEIVNMSGDIDGLMFQSHMIIQYATILLHLPRGDLRLAAPTKDIPPGCAAKYVCPCSRQHVHSVKAMEASRAISMLAALRIPAQKQTPLFTYPLVFCAVVQMSIFTTHMDSCSNLYFHRDCVKLVLGVLKSMSQYWLLAGLFCRALKRRALKTFENSARSLSAVAGGNDTTNERTLPLPVVNNDEYGVDAMDQVDFTALMDIDGLFDFNTGIWDA